jgi:hypothetical protein
MPFFDRGMAQLWEYRMSAAARKSRQYSLVTIVLCRAFTNLMMTFMSSPPLKPMAVMLVEARRPQYTDIVP